MSDVSMMPGSSLRQRIVDLWTAGRQILFWVGDENFRYERSIKEATVELNRLRAMGENDRKVRVVCHDRWAGFHLGLPGVPKCKNKTNALANGLQIAVMSKEEIAVDFNGIDLPFNPEDDLIFVFNSIDTELAAEHLTLTLMRNIMQANICSTSYTEERIDPTTNRRPTRGRRMIVVISPTSTLPSSIPELKPEIVPLPDMADLRLAAMDLLAPAWEDYRKSKGKTGYRPLEPIEMAKVINALCGMTSQDAEEALALALVQNPDLSNLDGFINTIEHEKARCIASIPGLSYVPKQQIDGETEEAMPKEIATLVTAPMPTTFSIMFHSRINVGQFKGV